MAYELKRNFKQEIQKRDLMEVDNYTKEDLENLLDNIPFSIWLKNRDGKYIFVNKKFIEEINENYKSRDKEALDSEVLEYHSDREYWSAENDEYIKEIDKYILENKSSVLEEELLNINGVNRWYESFRSCVEDENKKAKYIAGVAREITDSKRIDEQFTRGHWIFSDISKIFNKDESEIKELLKNISNEVNKKLNGTTSEFWIFDKDKKMFISVFNDDYTKAVLGEDKYVKLDYNVLRRNSNLYKNETILDLKNKSENINNQKLLSMGLRYIGIYNIEFKSEVLGFFTVGFTEENKPKYKQDDFVKSICSQLGILINNYNLRKEVKKEFQKRKEVERELEQLIDTAVDLIAIVNEDGKFLKLNERWTSILGWEKEEVLTIDFINIIHMEDREHLLNRLDQIKYSNCKKTFTTRCLCKNGEYKWIEWNAKLDYIRGVYIATGKDITEEKTLEAQRKVYEEALQLETIKNEFFANISHEFKTPLNIIISAMQLINSHIEAKRISVNSGVDLNKYIKAINQNSYRLLRLVNNLIDMTKIDTGYYDINLENYNIVSVIEDVTMSVAAYVENKGIELIFDTEIEELTVACDIDKIERIMLNLLSNAIKYSNENGKIEVYIKLRNNEVQYGGNISPNYKDGYCTSDYYTSTDYSNHLDLKDCMVEISVKDNGCGISKPKLPAIFERFIQVDEIFARRNEGSGIGLSLVKSLVEMHKGDIRVQSEEGVGSEFIFNIPIAIVKDKQNNMEKARIDSVKTSIEKCQIEFSDIYDLT